MTNGPKKRKGGALDYYFDAMRDKVEPNIRSQRVSGSLAAHELAILSFCKAEHSKRLGYAFASARAIATKVSGGPEAFDELDKKEQANRVRAAQYHIAHIARYPFNFVVERGGRRAGQRNAHRYWPAVNGVPIHKSYDAQAAARVAASEARYQGEREARSVKQKSGLGRWRQRKGIVPKICWAFDDKGTLFGEAGDWRITFERLCKESWSMTITGPDGARYEHANYTTDLSGQQYFARGFLYRVVKGQVEPTLTAEDAAELAAMFRRLPHLSL